jgi:hypothetical protein
MVQLIGQVGTLRPPPFSCFLRVFPFPLVGPPTKWAGSAARFGLVVQFLFSAKFICMGNRSNRLTAIQKKNQTSQIFPTWPFSMKTPTLELLAPAPARNDLHSAPEGPTLECYPGAAPGRNACIAPICTGATYPRATYPGATLEPPRGMHIHIYRWTYTAGDLLWSSPPWTWA